MGLSVCAGSTSCQMQVVFTSLTSMELRWVRRSKWSSSKSDKIPRKLKTPSKQPQGIPVYISNDQKDINLIELRDLYVQCNHSCHRFPNLDSESDNIKEVIDANKLHTALCHSAVVVSVFCKSHRSALVNSNGSDAENIYDNNVSYPSDHEKKIKGIGSLGDLLQNVVPVTPSNGQLVGFGRAVSDCGLTASIYDIMVIPPLRRMGIGKLIVRRIIRTLTNRGIYDIAALCSEHERLFFKACGFGDDVLRSTAMMYTKRVQNSLDGDNQMVRRAGRLLLLAPPPQKPVASSETSNSIRWLTTFLVWIGSVTVRLR